MESSLVSIYLCTRIKKSIDTWDVQIIKKASLFRDVIINFLAVSPVENKSSLFTFSHENSLNSNINLKSMKLLLKRDKLLYSLFEIAPTAFSAKLTKSGWLMFVYYFRYCC